SYIHPGFLLLSAAPEQQKHDLPPRCQKVPGGFVPPRSPCLPAGDTLCEIFQEKPLFFSDNTPALLCGYNTDRQARTAFSLRRAALPDFLLMPGSENICGRSPVLCRIFPSFPAPQVPAFPQDFLIL